MKMFNQRNQKNEVHLAASCNIKISSLMLSRTNYLMLKLLLIGALAIFSLATQAQISNGGTPPGIELGLEDSSQELVRLNPPDMQTVLAEDLENERNLDPSPRRMGVSVVAGLNTQNSGKWTSLKDGSKLWRLRINIEGALALGIYYDHFELPEGGRLFLYNKHRNQLRGAYTHFNNHESLLFANEFIQGDEVILEYHQEQGVEGDAIISISELAYAYRDIHFETRDLDGVESLWCMINVACEEGEGWEDQIRSAARISIKIGWNYFWCSGALINNTLNNREPYFLTASHCGGTASPADLNQWIFYFNYQASTCQGSSSGTNTITGCQLKARDPSQASNGSDFYLVKFNNTIPNSYNVFYSGWNRSSSNQNMPNGVSIHHPAGDIKKISTYSTPLISTSGWNGLPSHWMAVWANTTNGRSIVEGGSSGSPIYDKNGLIAGKLTGGYESNSCESPSPAFYGKMWYSWDKNGTTPETMLKDWLDPIENGTLMHPGVNWQIIPPTADFMADQTTIEQGMTVSFTDLSEPNILSWFWEFEGGIPAVSVEQEPGPILYTQTGSYAVSLTVTNADGTDTDTKSGYIEVFATQPPIAEFTSNITEVVAGSNVSFEDLSTGTPFAWAWILEGGSPAVSALQNPSIRYNNPGTYTVSLTATNYGGSDTKTVENYITVIEAVMPEADFEASETNIYNGEKVDFMDLSSGNPFAWYWEFEGGNPPSSENQHPQQILYANPGAYNVSLTAANQFGQHTSTKEGYIVVDLVGIKEDKLDLVRLYPNPGNGIFNLEFSEVLTGDVAITVMNNMGVAVAEIEAPQGSKQLRFDFSHLSDGVYLLMLPVEGQKIYRKVQIAK
jgi:lysyl endopeptidase